ncbi:L-arabinose isomerase [Paenibacillus sp. P1XP2]|nr:L-arabinose isomerase [Paenibacillus sp. P1XP2]
MLSYAITAENLTDFAEMAGIEAVVIDKNTSVQRFKNELLWSEAAYRLR